ncbi:DNA ligase 4 [Neocloeon triangulifer]|uniref:DNA ligase 4 n=1 Tax=Neocloeon triangulifer TaxID=2078957 RepID=UPI00286ED65F|nr:DNA ligase 4 [Neocloeon triangulifer]XP_059469629.1 DNA ligase 4 [Neocloeon triangulifer]XP_059469630.1 DNA ligase 4 [Neocloeon triangulifer]XP_059469631.1 DNA ligase 4 [Neocloeon triangulifer]
MASSMSFHELCEELENLSSMPSRPRYARSNAFRDFINKLRVRVEDDPQEKKAGLFPVVRLLMPALDRERGAYGVKEAVLARKYVKVLCLAESGPDAQQLLRYREPRGGARDLGGDFAGIASHVLKNYLSSKPSSFTVGQINKIFDSLAINNAENKPRLVDECLENLLRNTSATEQKWLIRMLLKSCRFGLGRRAIFYAIHPDAEKRFDSRNSLKDVCETLRDPAKRLNEIEICLGLSFSPMLSDKVDVARLASFFTPERQELYVETKLDGERVQIHKDPQGNFRYFSRNGFDFSSAFGTNERGGSLTHRLVKALLPSATSFILDGEMMAWDTARKNFKQKGQNVDVKSLPSQGAVVACFCAFDVLLFNGKVVTNKPLQERIPLLDSIFRDTPEVILKTPRWTVKNESEIRDSLNRAIDNRDEGIMLKDPNSVYKPSKERKGGWWKIKPEYNNELMEHLDVIVLGGYFGEGRLRGGLVSQFLLGVAKPPAVPGGVPSEFYSFSRVGSGYSKGELMDTLERLKDLWQDEQPPNVFVTKEKPDVWILPQKSLIAEIKASEIVPSSAYTANFTLRFPRVQKFRPNLMWSDCLNLDQLTELRKISAGKLAKHVTSSTAPGTKKRKAVAMAGPTVAAHFRPADLADVQRESFKFEGKEFCIWGLEKQKLEKLVAAHGGKVTQNAGPKTFAIVTDNKDSVRVQNLLKSSKDGYPKWDVLRSSWLQGAAKGERPMKPEPSDYFLVSKKSHSLLKTAFDEFGDSYTSPASLSSLKLVLERVPSSRPFEPHLLDQLEDELLGASPYRSIFRPCIAFFYQYDEDGSRNDYYWKLEPARLEFRLYGGRLSREFDRSIVTHIIASPLTSGEKVNKLQSQLSARNMFRIVTPDWIKHSRSAGYLMDEDNYQIN